MEKQTKAKMEKLRKFISGKNNFHWNQIHKILDEKEKGVIDINLDILYKIHNNGHSECVEILKLLNRLFPTTVLKSKQKGGIYDTEKRN